MLLPASIVIGLVLAPLVSVAAPAPVAVPAVAPLASGASGAPSVAPSSSVSVDESIAPVLAPATRTLAGWNELWAEVGKTSADLRIALAEIERAEAATRIAWGAALPTVNASATLTHIPGQGSGSASFQPSNTNALTMQISAVQPLVNLRAWHAIATSRELEDIAKLSVFDVRRKLALGLARAAVGIVSAKRLAELNRIGLEAALDRLLLTRKRLAAGVGDARDLVRAQQDVAASRAVIASADEQLVQAREALAQLLAIPGDLGLAQDADGIEKEILAFCGGAKPQKPGAPRIDVLIAEKQIEIAKRNVDDIALKFVPTLTAQLSANASGLAFSGPFATGWSLSGVLTIPLYDGGVRYGERRDRIAQVEEAEARAVQTKVGALIEISQARRAIAVAEAAESAAREARDLAKEADRLARLAYAAGIGTNFDLIDAGRLLRQNESQLVLRELDTARARLAIPFIEDTCDGVTK